MSRPTILNSKGQPIVLNEMEQRVADVNQRLVNALGYEVDITTLTTIVKKVSEAKYFQIRPSDYLPVRVGEGAWSSNLLTYLSQDVNSPFAAGVLNVGIDSARLASGDTGITSLSIPVKNWAKQNSWTIMELQQAAKAGNWDLVTAKEATRKRNWDLGIQKVAFLGLDGDASALGLLNQAGIPFDTTTITKAISSMTTAELKTFCYTILNVYRARNNRTAYPTHFIMPESDYLGLAAPASADFPIRSVMAVLLETFQVMTGNKDFKILPLAYADQAYSGQAYQQYVLLNYDDASIRMDIPVDYTNTLANSLNNFQYQNVAYGQFTGVLAYRPLELMYFKY